MKSAALLLAAGTAYAWSSPVEHSKGASEKEYTTDGILYYSATPPWLADGQHKTNGFDPLAWGKKPHFFKTASVGQAPSAASTAQSVHPSTTGSAPGTAPTGVDRNQLGINQVGSDGNSNIGILGPQPQQYFDFLTPTVDYQPANGWTTSNLQAFAENGPASVSVSVAGDGIRFAANGNKEEWQLLVNGTATDQLKGTEWGKDARVFIDRAGGDAATPRNDVFASVDGLKYGYYKFTLASRGNLTFYDAQPSTQGARWSFSHGQKPTQGNDQTVKEEGTWDNLGTPGIHFTKTKGSKLTISPPKGTGLLDLRAGQPPVPFADFRVSIVPAPPYGPAVQEFHPNLKGSGISALIYRADIPIYSTLLDPSVEYTVVIEVLSEGKDFSVHNVNFYPTGPTFGPDGGDTGGGAGSGEVSQGNSGSTGGSSSNSGSSGGSGSGSGSGGSANSGNSNNSDNNDDSDNSENQDDNNSGNSDNSSQSHGWGNGWHHGQGQVNDHNKHHESVHGQGGAGGQGGSGGGSGGGKGGDGGAGGGSGGGAGGKGGAGGSGGGQGGAGGSGGGQGGAGGSGGGSGGGKGGAGGAGGGSVGGKGGAGGSSDSSWGCEVDN